MLGCLQCLCKPEGVEQDGTKKFGYTKAKVNLNGVLQQGSLIVLLIRLKIDHGKDAVLSHLASGSHWPTL
jgi:hypothetical protein